MRLLIRRNQSDGGLGVNFSLWAKFEVDEEEQFLLSKYKAKNSILSEGNKWRDIRRGALCGAGLGIFAGIVLTYMTRTPVGLILLAIPSVFVITTFLIYHQ